MLNEEPVTINVIYDEILKNREEIKNVIKASETRMLMKIEELHSRLSKTERENKILREKVESLERQVRKNNIIIFGIQEQIQEVTPAYICHKFGNLLEIELTELDIVDIHPLGKNPNSPIKVELLSNIKKRSILKNSSKLKGKGISIAPDQTTIQREENKILRAGLARAREDKEKCFIKGNKLYVKNTSYTVEELIQLTNKENRKSTSAPSSPCVQTQDNNAEEIETEILTHSKSIQQEKGVGSTIHTQTKVTSKSNSNTPRSYFNKQTARALIAPGSKKDKIATRSTSQKK